MTARARFFTGAVLVLSLVVRARTVISACRDERCGQAGTCQ
jgi:hypothetical protein